MNIALWTDSHNFPSLPLMKISAYHKALGDKVEMLNHLKHYDKVYCSKVFSFTEDVDARCMVYANEIEKGGTGYHIHLVNGKETWTGPDEVLPAEIENICPDYSLYPENETAIGFCTRGCPRNCGFCIVSKKEGRNSRQVGDLDTFWRGQKNITLLDPNLLACRDHERILGDLIDSRAWVDFSQGLDIRLINPDNIKLINKVMTKMVHFAWDDAKTDLRACFDYYAKEGAVKDTRKRTVYILTNYDSTMEENLYRIYSVMDQFTPYVMIYDKEHAPREIKRLQRWCNSNYIRKKCPRFEDYKG